MRSYPRELTEITLGYSWMKGTHPRGLDSRCAIRGLIGRGRRELKLKVIDRIQHTLMNFSQKAVTLIQQIN